MAMTKLFEILCTVFVDSPFDGSTRSETKVLAVCSTKQKAISKLKEVADDPQCEGVMVHEYDEDMETTYISNRYGYRAEYYIQEIFLDEWID